MPGAAGVIAQIDQIGMALGQRRRGAEAQQNQGNKQLHHGLLNITHM
jgi:hypothetical protein